MRLIVCQNDEYFCYLVAEKQKKLILKSKRKKNKVWKNFMLKDYVELFNITDINNFRYLKCYHYYGFLRKPKMGTIISIDGFNYTQKYSFKGGVFNPFPIEFELLGVQYNYQKFRGNNYVLFENGLQVALIKQVNFYYNNSISYEVLAESHINKSLLFFLCIIENEWLGGSDSTVNINIGNVGPKSNEIINWKPLS